MENKDVGILLNKKNIELNRLYFKQMVKMLGINTLYRKPIPGSKAYNGYGELDAYFQPPEIVSAIYDESPNQKTYRKAGWAAELSETSTMLHVPYDVEDLQVGCLFILPSGLDNAEGRVFRVIRMQNIAVYPASITCELAPVYVDNNEPSMEQDFRGRNMVLLDDESDDYGH